MRRGSPAGRARRSPCAAACRRGSARTFSDASAIASSVSRGAPLGAVSVSRSLPLTWTAIVTSSSTSRAGSASGQAASAISPSLPRRRPGLLGDVRHHRRDQPDHRLDRGAARGRGRRLLDRIGELVDVGDRLVEGERLDIGADRGDRLVELAVERLVLAVAALAGGRGQPPEPLDEAPGALDPRLAPFAGRARAGCRRA